MLKLLSALLGLCAYVSAAVVPTVLQVESKEIIVNGKKAEVLTIAQPDGTWGYFGKTGDTFNVVVENKLNQPTVIHWHGLDLPNAQDGTELTQTVIPALGSYKYNFTLTNTGSYWMHSHYGLQAALLAEAPLIIESADDANYQQVVVMFQDFSFKSPQTILSELTKPAAKPMDMSGMDMSNMDAKSMANMQSAKTIKPSAHATMDLNDVAYDAYLTNYHTPDKPQIIQVTPGGQVKLRFINGSASSNFWLNLGKLSGTAVAVDGHDIQAYTANSYQLAEGQRMDILVTIPKSGGTFPVIGQVEGLKNQTGLILTTQAKSGAAIKTLAAKNSPPLNDTQELQLVNNAPFSAKPADKIIQYTLSGDMKSYVWKINNQVWPKVTPVKIKQGQRVEMDFINKTMMPHPMHLHGYSFKIVEVNGHKINGALRDTIEILPGETVKVVFDATVPGKWFLHCHIAWHMQTGMMTYIEVN